MLKNLKAAFNNVSPHRQRDDISDTPHSAHSRGTPKPPPYFYHNSHYNQSYNGHQGLRRRRHYDPQDLYYYPYGNMAYGGAHFGPNDGVKLVGSSLGGPTVQSGLQGYRNMNDDMAAAFSARPAVNQAGGPGPHPKPKVDIPSPTEIALTQKVDEIYDIIKEVRDLAEESQWGEDVFNRRKEAIADAHASFVDVAKKKVRVLFLFL